MFACNLPCLSFGVERSLLQSFSLLKRLLTFVILTDPRLRLLALLTLIRKFMSFGVLAFDNYFTFLA